MRFDLPPYARTLGLQFERDGRGPLVRLPFSSGLEGRPGFLHGGAIAGLLEIAGIATMIDTLEDGPPVRAKPVNVTVDFLRGGRVRDTLAAAIVTRLGTRIANVAVEAWQDDRSRPIAAARMTFLLNR